MEKHKIPLVCGLVVLFFGISVGGAGLASAGVGIALPVVPIGIYLTYRGWRIFKYGEENKGPDFIYPEPLQPLEETKLGKVGLGILMILIGTGTSAAIVGIPILVFGLWVIYSVFKSKIHTVFNKR